MELETRANGHWTATNTGTSDTGGLHQGRTNDAALAAAKPVHLLMVSAACDTGLNFAAADNQKLGDSNTFTKVLWVACATILDVASNIDLALSTAVEEAA